MSALALLAHGGHGHEGAIPSWQLVMIGFLYFSLASGLALGMLLGQRSRPPAEPEHMAPVRPLRRDDVA